MYLQNVNQEGITMNEAMIRNMTHNELAQYGFINQQVSTVINDLVESVEEEEEETEKWIGKLNDAEDKQQDFINDATDHAVMMRDLVDECIDWLKHYDGDELIELQARADHVLGIVVNDERYNTDIYLNRKN